MVESNSHDEREVERTSQFVRQNQRFRRRPKRPADLVSRVISRYGIAAEQSTSQLDQAWMQAVPPAIARRTRVARIRRNVLEVIVQSSAIVQQLSFQKKQILKSINHQHPQAQLNDLKFTVGQID